MRARGIQPLVPAPVATLLPREPVASVPVPKPIDTSLVGPRLTVAITPGNRKDPGLAIKSALEVGALKREDGEKLVSR